MPLKPLHKRNQRWTKQGETHFERICDLGKYIFSNVMNLKLGDVGERSGQTQWA